jgi:SagB-type dehydrogenase family enzyme
MSNADHQTFKFAATFGADVFDIVDEFHEYSKITHVIDPDFNRRIHLFLQAPPVRHLAVRAWREYVGYPRIALPPEARLGGMTLEDAMRSRRSFPNRRGGQGAPLTEEKLSAILKYSYGETGSIDAGKHMPTQPLRATCSAGGLYPLEIYPLVFNVPNIDPGVYHYHVPSHSLEQVRKGQPREALLKDMPHQEMCQSAGAILIITAVLERSLSKYLHRGYRFVMNDCGALAQSLYLTATAAGVDACAWGGFQDDALAEFVGVDGRHEIVALAFVLGRIR